MNRTYLIPLFAVLCIVAAASPGVRAEVRGVAPLDGVWQFRMDPENCGETERWFSGQTPFESAIEVPGAWDAQGFGAETDILRHQFTGTGWYKRNVTIPTEWTGRPIFLCFGGVHRYAKVWVNGTFLGEHIGYLSPFEYDVTALVTPGAEATIVAAVDAKQRWDVDCLTGCFDILDAMDTPWGGIWGHVTLEARRDAWLDQFQVRAKAATGEVTLSARLCGDPASLKEVTLAILDAEGTLVESIKSGGPFTTGGTVSLSYAVPAPTLWTPDTPYLYTARLSVGTAVGIVVDAVSSRFGFRDIETRGPNFYLNGARFFLRGYGDDCVYPKLLAAPSNKEAYLERLRVIKQYGFNGVRHHSTILPPEYFEACDEAGILVQPELPIAYQPFYERAKGPALELYQTEWAAAIVRLRNHPSVFAWCMGNEMYNGVPHDPALYDIAKTLDPDRLVIDSDGLSNPGVFDGGVDRRELDYYSYQFDVFRIPLDAPGKYAFADAPKKPVISHETGNFGTFPLLDQIEMFDGAVKPFWLIPAREKLTANGLLGEAELWSKNSMRLYYLCHKMDIEDLRKNPFISGHHWWLFQDYWTGSNGLVEANYRPKAEIKPDMVKRFINDAVLLENGLWKTWRCGDRVTGTLSLSNFSGTAIEQGALLWKIAGENGCLAATSLTTVAAAQGDVTKISDVAFTCPPADKPYRYTLSASLTWNGRTIENAWDVWVYPAPAETPLAAPICASPDLVDRLAKYGAKPIPETEDAGPGAVYVSSMLTPALVDRLEAGAVLLLPAPEMVFPTTANRFKTTWWLGNATDNNVGTVAYGHDLVRDLTPDGWCDQSWYTLLEGARACILDEFPARPEVLLRGIDVHTMCRDKALLFQAKVGEGTLIVSGLRLLSPNADAPEAQWLLRHLLDYACTHPAATVPLPVEFLREKAKAAMPLEGGARWGFAKLCNADAEMSQWYSYWDDSVPIYICRQDDQGNRVEWETTAVPAEFQDDALTFVFAGGMGFRGQPKTEGFAFAVNGQPALDFDLAQEKTDWKSADGAVTLTFLPKRDLDQDVMGQFYVTIPRNLLEPGKPCTLSVTSKGGGSQRWFGINPWTVLPAGE